MKKGLALACAALLFGFAGTACNTTEANPDFVPDTGDDVDADPCAEVERPCEELGGSCLEDGDGYVECRENADGCLVEVNVSCDIDELCVQGDQDASCEEIDPCTGLDLCDVEGALSCDDESGELLRCEENADGCLANVATDCSEQNAGASCIVGGEAGAYCSIPDVCDEVEPGACVEPATSFCDPEASLVECELDGDGCLVESAVDCSLLSETFVCRDDLDPASCGAPLD